MIVPKLYTLFDAKKWKVRWVAASSSCKTIDDQRASPSSCATCRTTRSHEDGR